MPGSKAKINNKNAHNSAQNKKVSVVFSTPVIDTLFKVVGSGECAVQASLVNKRHL